jgi:hypothetical protein
VKSSAASKLENRCVRGIQEGVSPAVVQACLFSGLGFNFFSALLSIAGGLTMWSVP